MCLVILKEHFVFLLGLLEKALFCYPSSVCAMPTKGIRTCHTFGRIFGEKNSILSHESPGTTTTKGLEGNLGRTPMEASGKKYVTFPAIY